MILSETWLFYEEIRLLNSKILISMKRMTRSCTIKFYFKKTSRFLRFLRKFVRFRVEVKNISVKI